MDDTAGGGGALLAELTGHLRRTDPDLARHLTARALPATPVSPTPIAVLFSPAL